MISLRLSSLIARITTGALCFGLWASDVTAQGTGTGQSTVSLDATNTASGSSPPSAGHTSATCTEHVPSGKERPSMEEVFPARALAGHAAALVLKIVHGKGERVLDDSFEFQAGSDGAAALRRAGFEFPTRGSPAIPEVKRTEGSANATTEVTLNVIPLPSKAGQQTLSLPPLPIAIARPSGEIMTLCSATHVVEIDDPTANVPNALPKRHPGPERQHEIWTTLRNLVYGGLIGLLLATCLVVLTRWYKRRPRALPPPPPPRPAWEIALEELHDIRHAELVKQGRLTAHLERVNHTLRAYLGRSYNFDGLESTTVEVLQALKLSTLPNHLFLRTEAMLHDSDLVKFAKIQPTEAQCHGALDDVEQLVKQTMHDERNATLATETPAATQMQSTVTASAVLRSRGVESATTSADAPGTDAAQSAKKEGQ
jgi:hypothetical protein